MKFIMEVNRGYILDIINLADNNNLVINLISQKSINDNLLNINLELIDSQKSKDIKKFLQEISTCKSINSYKII